MGSSSTILRKRRGKSVAYDDDDNDFDEERFKSPFHQNFFNTYVASTPIVLVARIDISNIPYPQFAQQIQLRVWKRLNKPKKKISESIIREFYANARINPESEASPRFYSFVRGTMINFSYEKVKEVMKFGGLLMSETSYRTRMIPNNHDLEVVIRDLCVEGATWGLGAQNTPRHLKRTELNPIARG
ncbi:hypothetical protein PIB30_102464 [Stylosanthes scabra]|uniref:Putative plant transposon protein domain-containing protein n=1 Tax=Stylosanthes scabra TaxID=79078 RepID=A0ABU6YVI3_9FABA|nr:hypothetical protein [Stylosanthes scabra]